jgi:hypothetical protein
MNNIDIDNRKQLNNLGYNSNKYYCGNYSMQKYYSYIYNKMKKLGVKFALNRACFIHDIHYSKNPNLKEKLKIDKQFYNDMQQCIFYEYHHKNISLRHAIWLRGVALLFYIIVLAGTPFYIKPKRIKKK